MNDNKISIDYSALDNLPTGIQKFLPIIFGILSFVCYFLSNTYTESSYNVLLIVATILFLIGTISVSIINYSKRKNSLSKFATANGFVFTSGFSNFQNEPGSIFDYGYSRKIGNILSGKLGSYQFRDGTYRYKTESESVSIALSATGVNRSNNQTLYIDFMCIELPRKLPQIIINSKKEYALQTFYSKKQKLSLEGDFYKYFDVYAPQNYETTTLAILSPEVMAFLEDNATHCDIEIVDSKLYLYWHKGMFENKSDYSKKFDLAISLLSKIGRELSTANIVEKNDDIGQAGSSDGLTESVKLKKSIWQ